MKFIAFTVKGIEEIAKQEILRIFPEAHIIQVESKAIIFDPKDNDLKKLTDLTTVDDVAVYAYEIEYTRNLNHKIVADLIAEINFAKYREIIGKFRDAKPKIFSLTVSLPGLKNLKSDPFKKLLSETLTAEKNWQYTERDHTNFDIRVFLGDGKIYIGVRLATMSLHDRAYKEFYKRGSLRPTIAAALIDIATEGKPGKLVDNFCGSGTILAEAYLKGNDIYGGDIDRGSVELTKKNLTNLDVEFGDEERLRVEDATNTKWEDKSFDYAVSNLPWNKQIEVESFTDLFREALLEYKRVLKDGFTMVLLSQKAELLISLIREVFGKVEITEYPISLVGQQPVILKVRKTK